ncbi:MULTISPECIES: hypothetical protein [Marisediminitalea]|jgi:hypothetical protein|uniref:hypothetical protein n=1 Tax=Marisediminitalea TaxID=2662254 RepID=UPI000C428AAD|nr:hypothetical protein [Marisediminitalea aggregata]MBL52611.1 hypothetical protein [Alteromonadaceae bacterium]MCP9478008.1 hypothetical protein [Marisediminitalea aggregata]|tara:strand:+ start:9830 stop:10093 length:264 start_codon:yes stop_codon:yes gene_type:complete
MKGKLAVIGMVSLVMMGCNSTDSATTAKADTNADEHDGVVCKLEKRVGSNMMTKVCRTAEERQAERDAANEAMTRYGRTRMTSGADN